MSEKLKEFDFTSSSPRRTDGSFTYPWDDWFDGDIWKIDQGVDFPGHPLMMERIIRTRATNWNAKIRLRHMVESEETCPKCGQPSKGSLVIQRYDIQGPTEAKKEAAREKRAATRAGAANGNGKPVNGKAVAKAPAKTKRPVKKVSVPA